MSSPRIKVSQMSTALTLNPTDTIMIIQDGVNKKISITNLLKNFDSADSIRLNPSQYAVDISIASKNDPNAIYVQGTQDKIGFGTNSPQSKVHVNGNMQVGSATTDGITVQSTESVVAADSITVNPLSSIRASTYINCNSGISGKFSLPAGQNGQIKYIVVNTLSGGSTATLTLTGLGFNTVTCTAVGNSITIQYISALSKWCVVSLYGATLSTV